MIILAIDPGTTASGFVFFDCATKKILLHKKIQNEQLLLVIDKNKNKFDYLILEMLNCGRKLGETTLQTAIWIGRFIERFNGRYLLVRRSEILKFFEVKTKKEFGGLKTTDAKIKYILKELYDTKGMTGDEVQGLALAHFVLNNMYLILG